MLNPTISIVMPVYNAGVYLKDAIQDILHQTYTDFELICVDDGSTDQSKDVLNYYADSDDRIHIISQYNQGAGAARNIGIDNAKGKYLLFLDADDRFELNLLKNSVSKIKDTNADIVLFGIDTFYSDSGIIVGGSPAIKPDTDKCYSYIDYPVSLFSIHGATVWNKLYNTEFVRQSNVRFRNSPYMNDVFFSVMTVVIAEKIEASGILMGRIPAL